ncbi:MAG: glycosyltransferase family 4 protein [Symploca sp. SIO2E6]|nr:glycosyltransferase family 4 protein [Symploca sp. SIO2E6]
MSSNNFKVLLIINECNPEWASVPLEGYKFYDGISKLVDTTLVTHIRNQPALEKIHSDRDITYIDESKLIKRYYKIAAQLSKVKNKTIWPLHNALMYPVYGEFDHLVYSNFKAPILGGDYDIVHAITPMMPRYPVKVVKVCQKKPFMLGPVNGGVPFPRGFQEIAFQEFSYFNFLRAIGRLLIPGYRRTYKEADYILAGSTYTLNFLKEVFNIDNQRIELFYENGISDSFIKKEQEVGEVKSQDNQPVNLLFVGRLVPYKGADMVIEAVSKLEASTQEKIILTIVGDGSERNALEQQVQQTNLEKIVNFTGWVPQQETLKYYSNADIFCFPSIREFGGAVVLEAMANGLPCIVVNNGGIGEYVTAETGFSINPVSREFVVQELKKSIEELVQNQTLRQNMSQQAIKRAVEFTWNVKAEKIVDTYRKLLVNG